eukprot:CAMPEP_0181290442 /NCGR_PEP_ID=MMETSP1101-20121128/1416_1 /TAXON_ID=46948 /ORGANISM="Rhodomonas abbreviata, Strain Caron Lab Isolate" /LENGTH=177 /DNA_ID=CAMNT_0023394727 /DNA_START=38 /DNA_END=571 /DNA_ORIENTATION=-
MKLSHAAAAGALLVLCALCFQFAPTQQAVELSETADAKSVISSLISSMTGKISAKRAGMDPIASLSQKDYSLEQMKGVAKMIRLAEKYEQVGYLRKGNSLPNMPIQFYEGTDKKHGHYTVRGQCEAACIDEAKCKAYTYLTETGKCYLKDAVKPGLNPKNACDSKSCWYFGVLTEKH